MIVTVVLLFKSSALVMDVISTVKFSLLSLTESSIMSIKVHFHMPLDEELGNVNTLGGEK